jgi:hypothetical protein
VYPCCGVAGVDWVKAGVGCMIVLSRCCLVRAELGYAYSDESFV